MSDEIPLRGPWSRARLDDYLQDCTTPLRLACHAGRGFPVIVPLWFAWHEGSFWCATHRSARLLDYLRADDRVGFEVANNHPPYLGVRGHGRVELFPEAGGEWLERLLERYLGTGRSDFSDWLLSRKEDEYALRLRPQRLSVWDYRPRMPGPSAE